MPVEPTVSVVVPAYNALPNVLEIRLEIPQSFHDFTR